MPFDPTLILIAVALAVFVFFQFRSSRKRAKENAERQASILPGVEIMTNYGLFGTIVSIDEENNFAFIETSPGNIVKIHRSTILKPADDLVAPAETEEELEEEGTIPVDDLAVEPEFGERTESTKPAQKPRKKTGE
jgi:preprotein translocase subunit YajC